MAVRRTLRRGREVFVIDFAYVDANGAAKRYRRDARAATAAAAQNEERALVRELDHGPEAREDAESGGELQPTFTDAARYFFTHRALSLKPSTQHGYAEVCRNTLMPLFGDRPVASLSLKDFAEMDAALVRRGVGAARRRNHIVTLRSILRAAVVGELLDELPKFPPVPKVGMKVPRAPSPEEVAACIDAARPSMRVALALAAYAGLRAGEVRALRRMDVDLDEGVIVVRQAQTRGVIAAPKSGHEREIPIAAALRPFLEEAAFRCPSPSSIILEHASKLRLGDGLLRRELAKAQRRANAGGWSFHGLRHAFVTQLFRRGVPAPVVQRLAGHIHLSVTQRYAHTNVEDLRSAIALL